MKSEIYVVSHKQTRMPEGDIYYPLQVGSASKDFQGYLRDNTGDNIADRNSNYSELTAQYWVAHNRHADVKGIVHYRRLFSDGGRHFFATVENKYKHVLNKEKLDELMKNYDMILPRKRNYYIETSWSHYEHIHHIKDLEITRKVLKEMYPDYVSYFDKCVNRTKAHMFNMFIAKSNIFDQYTDWLMDVLFEVEKQTDITGYTSYEQRIYGFISELLMDVWVEKNNINYVEIPVMFMGKQHWVKKITSFLLRKVKGSFDKGKK